MLVQLVAPHSTLTTHSLKDLHNTFGGKIPLCLHGTDELPDELFVECIENGISKVTPFPSMFLSVSSPIDSEPTRAARST
jgi:fructose/tagatose bisphosphate aldolase